MKKEGKRANATFQIKPGKFFDCLEDILLEEGDEGDTIVFPDCKSIKLKLSHPEQMEHIRKLIIPESVKTLDIQNSDFPNLEKIELKGNNFQFWEQGRNCLTQKDKDGKVMLLNVWCRDEVFEIPDMVSSIAAGAFCGTTCKISVSKNRNKVLNIDSFPAAFAGSLWYQECKQQGYFQLGSQMVLLQDIQTQYLNIPDEVTSILGKYSVTCDTLEIGQCLTEVAKHHIQNKINANTIRVRGDIQAFHMMLAGEMKGKARLESSSENYIVCDDILYTKDKKELVYEMTKKQIEVFHIPDEVEEIREYAFASCKNIRHLILPSNLQEIQPEAFAGSEFDCVEFPNDMEYIEFMRVGVFKEATVKKVIIHGGTKYVGNQLLEGLKNWQTVEIIIEEGVQEFGANAWFDDSTFSFMTSISHIEKSPCRISIPNSVKALHRNSLGGWLNFIQVSGHTKNAISAAGCTTQNIILCRKEDDMRFMIPYFVEWKELYRLNRAWNEGLEKFNQAYVHMIQNADYAKRQNINTVLPFLWFCFQHVPASKDACRQALQGYGDNVWLWTKEKIEKNEKDDLLIGCLQMAEFQEDQIRQLLDKEEELAIRSLLLEKLRKKRKEEVNIIL